MYNKNNYNKYDNFSGEEMIFTSDGQCIYRGNRIYSSYGKDQKFENLKKGFYSLCGSVDLEIEDFTFRLDYSIALQIEGYILGRPRLKDSKAVFTAEKITNIHKKIAPAPEYYNNKNQKTSLPKNDVSFLFSKESKLTECENDIKFGRSNLEAPYNPISIQVFKGNIQKEYYLWVTLMPEYKKLTASFLLTEAVNLH